MIKNILLIICIFLLLLIPSIESFRGGRFKSRGSGGIWSFIALFLVILLIKLR